jgi:hypothetical protein
MGTGLIGLPALMAVVVALAPGSAAASGTKKLVEGTVYDTTCATACVLECPPPPHCGPVPPARANVICAQSRRIIACPLAGTAPETSPPVCLPASGCVAYPLYSGEGAVVKVRRRGSARVLAALPVVEGHFEVRLGGGEYVLHPYLPEEPCWAGLPTMLKVWPKWKGPLPTEVTVSNSCVAHRGAAK